MGGLTLKGQAGAWQLISVNINRHCSVGICVIAEKTSGTCWHARTSASHFHHPRDEILGCSCWDKLWWQVWARHVVGFGTDFQN